MAPNGIDVQDMQRLDGHIEITAKYPIACGGYADIYPGIWHGGLAFLGPGVWTGDSAVSGRNVAVGTVDIYIVPLPHSRTLPSNKVAIKVFRDAHNKANTPEAQWKYLKLLNKEYRVWALLRHPNVLPLFGLIDDPAIPSTGIVAPRCTFGDLRAFFSDPARASVNRLPIVRVTFTA
ncbi:uncharacterized protein LACBIDRAFT_309899 [Laccaria bicolor S238N-H82]|uniref:Predicted protein n=1 Tax=Laccaria bicolor (strain S238N-H82 / ATCC MYA-4686) TaxID=486041 RepID=B0DTB4_LACBS|nr:uncharacterized protein LACBIDRAFT_309899 [Laccaria bicolor S238N-H82]EDR02191.1 predicted protein [Laccaria bicolor S238N-H82]|eukprot:XP_001887136.1 predicted protein [Laccaria bicolor S238N-H82]